MQKKIYRHIYFFSSVTSRITAEDFQNIWTQQVIPLNGNIKGIIKSKVTNESGYTVVYVTCNISKIAVLDVKISFNDKKKIFGLLVVPTQKEFNFSPPS
ncbi:hypothetical protein AYK25_02250 [Thermoplasmatales archaeon SM1-50]|nr:MAG: hypothetical protein AYK25_02250 [Thermoplasmatales archaeon SM1-50]